MNRFSVASVLLAILLTLTMGLGLASAASTKYRIAVVSSYHPEYLWSQDTNRGDYGVKRYSLRSLMIEDNDMLSQMDQNLVQFHRALRSPPVLRRRAPWSHRGKS